MAREKEPPSEREREIWYSLAEDDEEYPSTSSFSINGLKYVEQISLSSS